MLKDVVEVRPLGGYRVHLCFEDGVEGALDPDVLYAAVAGAPIDIAVPAKRR